MPLVETVCKFILPLRVGGELRYMVFSTEPQVIDWGLFVSAWLAFLLFAVVVLAIVSVAVNTEGVFGQSHGRADMVLQLVKTGLIIVTYAQPHVAPAFGLLKLAAAGFLLASLLYFVPYARLVTNQWRAASFSLFFWVVLVETAVSLGQDKKRAGDVLLLGIAPAMLLGYAAMWVRWRVVAAKLPPAEDLVAMIMDEATHYDRLLKAFKPANVTDIDIAVRTVMFADGVKSRTWGGLGWLCGIEAPGADDESDEETQGHGHGGAAPAARGAGGVGSTRRFGRVRSGGVTPSASTHDLASPTPSAVSGGGGGAGDSSAASSLLGRRKITREQRLLVAQWLYARGYALRSESSRLWVSYLNFCHEHHLDAHMKMSTTTIVKVNTLDVR
jgi:hypothetical protein